MTFFSAFKNIYGIFLKIGFRKKRTKLFIFLSFIPFIILLVIKIIALFTGTVDFSAPRFFVKIAPAFYMQFLIGVTAVFFSTSVLGEEIDDKTLPYLTSRPVSKPAILLGKFAAYYTLMVMMILAGVFTSFLAANLDRLDTWSIYPDFLQFTGAIFPASLAYGAVFLLLSTFARKTVMIALIYLFGFESFVQYLPGFTQKLTIIHYVKSLIPQVSVDYSFLAVNLQPSSIATSIEILLALSAVSLALAMLVFSRKEYVV